MVNFHLPFQLAASSTRSVQLTTQVRDTISKCMRRKTINIIVIFIFSSIRSSCLSIGPILCSFSHSSHLVRGLQVVVVTMFRINTLCSFLVCCCCCFRRWKAERDSRSWIIKATDIEFKSARGFSGSVMRSGMSPYTSIRDGLVFDRGCSTFPWLA